MINLCLIGAGRIGAIHAACVAKNSDVYIKYVCDMHQASAERIANNYGAQVVEIKIALADPEIQGVIIASPTDTHATLIEQAALAGKTIFCEKPVDLTIDKVKACVDVINKTGVECAIGFNRRFDKRFGELKQAIVAGKLGTLEMLHITSRDPSPPPLEYIKVSGGLFKDMMIHDFDMARWLLAEEPVEVFAMASCQVDPLIATAGDVDTAVVTLKTQSGKLCQISNSRRAVYGYDQRIEAFGSEGMLQVNNVLDSGCVFTGAQGSDAGKPQHFFLERYAEAYSAELDNFIGIIRGESKPITSVDDGYRALVIAEAALESLQTGRAVTIGF